jgi:DNA-binding CsgD family transcriptional regulator
MYVIFYYRRFIVLAENNILYLLSNGHSRKEIPILISKSLRTIELDLEKLRDQYNCKTTLELMFLYGKSKAKNDEKISNLNPSISKYRNVQ